MPCCLFSLTEKRERELSILQDLFQIFVQTVTAPKQRKKSWNRKNRGLHNLSIISRLFGHLILSTKVGNKTEFGVKLYALYPLWTP